MASNVSPGRNPKTSVFRFRARAYYYSIAREAERLVGKPVTAADLTRLFAADIDGPSSKVWYSYKAGDHLPGRGSFKSRDANLAAAIELKFPRASAWRDHPFWSLVDRVELNQIQVHGLMLDLPVATSIMLFGKLGDNEYTRWFGNAQFEVDALLEHGTFDDFAGVMALLREAELRQELFRFEPARVGMLKMLPRLSEIPEIAPFADELITYLRETFTHLWTVVPGHYVGRPKSA